MRTTRLVVPGRLTIGPVLVIAIAGAPLLVPAGPLLDPVDPGRERVSLPVPISPVQANERSATARQDDFSAPKRMGDPLSDNGSASAVPSRSPRNFVPI